MHDDSINYGNKLIDSWLIHNNPYRGVAWEPYVTSIRVVNLIKWSWIQNRYDRTLCESIYAHTIFIAKNIEWHIMGNHLIANIKALLFSGYYFRGALGKDIITESLAMLKKELRCQFNQDGGHYENTPMYHSMMLHDLLDILQLLLNGQNVYNNDVTISLVSELKTRIKAGLLWLQNLTHPDQDISFFNDATMSSAPRLPELTKYAELLDIKVASHSLESQYLADSGFGILQNKRAKLIANVADISPSYQPGHSHACSLSFELSISGQRVIVNSGVSTYEGGSLRSFQRGTSAYSTVSVCNLDSSEVWSSFRVAKRAKITSHFFHKTNECSLLSGTHDGYCRLKQGPTHTRNWRLSDGLLSITDTLSNMNYPATSRLYLHPDIKIKSTNGNITLLQNNGDTIIIEYHGANLTVNDTQWYLSFGKSQSNKCLTFQFLEETMNVTLRWSNK